MKTNNNTQGTFDLENFYEVLKKVVVVIDERDNKNHNQLSLNFGESFGGSDDITPIDNDDIAPIDKDDITSIVKDDIAPIDNDSEVNDEILQSQAVIDNSDIDDDFERFGCTEFQNIFLNTTDKYNVFQYYKTVGKHKKPTYKFDLDPETRVYQKRFCDLVNKIKQYEASIKETTKKSIRNGVNSILIHIISNLGYISTKEMYDDGDKFLSMNLGLKVLKSEIKIGRAVYYDSINFLVENKVIHRVNQTKFYINPKYFFAGNRMTFLEYHTPTNLDIKNWIEEKVK